MVQKHDWGPHATLLWYGPTFVASFGLICMFGRDFWMPQAYSKRPAARKSAENHSVGAQRRHYKLHSSTKSRNPHVSVPFVSELFGANYDWMILQPSTQKSCTITFESKMAL